ncbi:apoptotic chromatin condensation inducer in the nucleus-like isoform X1 [Biomphalaria glabrata]|nr:apoptotic chromatin condensation inducer in the nucleus-like isoform X1 [Biomphalaria glabrata]
MDQFKKMKQISLLIGFLLVTRFVRSQNPIFATQAPGGSGSNTNNVFYFDSRSDCNSGVRNLFGSQATIIGSNASAHSNGVTTCTITLKSEGTFDGTILDINVEAMYILDCLTQVSIYDGDGAKILLNSYDCRSSQNANRRQFVTSGNVATFIMTRPNPNSYNFDVKITVNPISSGLIVPTGSIGLVDFTKFPQEGIVGMIAGFYVFVILLCIAIIFYMARTFKGANQKWETHELANVRTGINFDSKSQLNKPIQISTLEGLKNRPMGSQYSRTTQPTLRKSAPPSEDGDSGVYYNEETFQKAQLMKREKEAKNRFVANTAFNGQEDRPDNFREKIIVPSKHKSGNRRPPSYDEVVSDSASERSSDEESDASAPPRKRSASSEEESDRSSARSRSSERSSVRSSERSRSTARTRSTRFPSPSDTESEEEGHSDDSSSRRQARAYRRKPKKHSEPKRHQPPRQVKQQQLPPQMQQPYMQPPIYGAYPPGQYVPIMTAPPPFQPIPSGYPPPSYTVQPQNTLAPQPTDIPVYSYLVQRGYKPVDDLNVSHSSTDSHRSRGRRLEEPDLRLESGVEYMKR